MHDEPAFVALGFKSNRRGLPLEHVRVATYRRFRNLYLTMNVTA